MRIIALMNQKGGVGKTTTTVNLGAALAEQGKRVCLIDLDPQAHLTINYGVEPNGEHISLYDVLIDDASFLEAVHKIDQRVALVPSSIDLAAAEIELVSVPSRETILKRKMESAQHDFDFVLLDCPPSLGLLTLNALSVATEVIIPMQPHFLALQGVAKLLETVHLVSQRINPRLKVSGVILTMFDAQTKLSAEVVAELNGFISQAEGKPLPWAGAKVFKQKIRRNIKLAECPSFGQTILKYDPASNGAIDYRNLARELLGLPPIAAPIARSGLKVTQASSTKTVKPNPPGSAPIKITPAPPAMPPALASAIKTHGLRKPAPAKTQAPAAVQGMEQPPTSAATPPVGSVPKLVLTPPPLPPRPAVNVTINPTIDQKKLAASELHKSPASPSLAGRENS
jgi:chromosome partitioning protein